MPKDDLAADWSRAELPMQETAALRQALAEASLPTLLMVYVHLNRDEAMLQRFAPFIHPAMSGQPTVIPQADAEILRDRLLDVLTRPGAASEEPLPHALMQKMMTVCVGEPVDDEFVPLLLDQMGLELPRPRREDPARAKPPADFRVLVIGAGLSGIAAGIKLGEAGYSYLIIEKNADVGGTWYENSYPGVGVDTPSHFYSYSFEINPDWSTYYPKGKEMLTYFRRVADKYNLRDNIWFETRVVSCVFDEASSVWNVRVRDKQGAESVLQANAVINCHGPVNRWSWPDIPGFEDFKGSKMHTAGWDHDVPIAGQNVAVIGTGASSAQLVPAIAAEARNVTVFMRSKHWVINNPEIGNVVTDGKRWGIAPYPPLPGMVPFPRLLGRRRRSLSERCQGPYLERGAFRVVPKRGRKAMGFVLYAAEVRYSSRSYREADAEFPDLLETDHPRSGVVRRFATGQRCTRGRSDRTHLAALCPHEERSGLSGRRDRLRNRIQCREDAGNARSDRTGRPQPGGGMGRRRPARLSRR